VTPDGREVSKFRVRNARSPEKRHGIHEREVDGISNRDMDVKIQWRSGCGNPAEKWMRKSSREVDAEIR
jgi:hypothetical protein